MLFTGTCTYMYPKRENISKYKYKHIVLIWKSTNLNACIKTDLKKSVL